MIKFLFFAQLAEQADRNSLELQYQEGKPVCDYIELMAKYLPSDAIETLNDGATMVSINQNLAAWDHTVADGDEVGLLPPFSGG
ncbi:MAG: MoaD/ThiS family protein [Acidiferrobacterales bacterium]|nr:MoaD/ThiS family protein [Acidiferrobacterales bacterium]